jgi:hypothetical protein
LEEKYSEFTGYEELLKNKNAFEIQKFNNRNVDP